MKKILVLGATGSIGSSTLDIARNMPQKFSVCAVTAHSNTTKLESISKEFKCEALLTSLCKDVALSLTELIQKTKPDIVVNGIAGSAGLLPSKIVLQNKIPLALANKETVVMAWPLIKTLAEQNNVPIIPVDSEHSAIFSLIRQAGKQNIDSIVITASGGPFREFSAEQLKNVTLFDALKHPTWNMGKKITIDSATLANKGLEVIEAVRLFDMPTKNVQVVVHPQSLVHSLVRTKDGMLYAQISGPDMKHPIFSALTYPNNEPTYLEPFNLFDKTMTFFKPRTDVFPMLDYAYNAAEKGGSYTIAYNAANEVAVEAFLNERISFTDIPSLVHKVLCKDWNYTPNSFEDVFEADSKARQFAKENLPEAR